MPQMVILTCILYYGKLSNDESQSCNERYKPKFDVGVYYLSRNRRIKSLKFGLVNNVCKQVLADYLNSQNVDGGI